MLHMMWRRGIMPASGALDDQPAGYSAVIMATETGIKSGRVRTEEIETRKAERRTRGKGSQQRNPRRTSR